MQEELKERTAKGEYSAMFTIIKEAAVNAKRDLDNENRRFMSVHGQVKCLQLNHVHLFHIHLFYIISRGFSNRI